MTKRILSRVVLGTDPVVTAASRGGRPARPAADVSASLAERIADLELQLAGLRQQQADTDDARFLRALAIGTRGHVFTVRDLVDLAVLDRDVRDALQGLRPKQLGKRLARLVGRDVHGLRVARVKLADTGAWIWVLHFHDAAGDRG
jgi:hypothetical protein